MSDVLKDISKSMAEQFDNNLAKAFVMQAGNALIRNGIKVWYYHKKIDSQIEEKENEVTYKDTYAIYFDRVDTSEHDAKIRADVIDEVLEMADHSVTLRDLCGGLRLIQKNTEEQKMANSLRSKLSHLRHKNHITEEEYKELISKLEGHDREVRKITLKPLSDVLLEYRNGDCTSMDALSEVYQIVEGQLRELQKEQKE